MDGKISDAEALMSLVKDDTAHRSKIGRLRGVFREIEQLQVSGLSNQAIVGKLNELGYGLTVKTFETMLHRIRKEAGTTKSSLKKAVPGIEKSTRFTASEADQEGRKTIAEESASTEETLTQVIKEETREAKFAAYSKGPTNPLKKLK